MTWISNKFVARDPSKKKKSELDQSIVFGSVDIPSFLIKQ